jgi:endoglucanase
MNPQCRRLFAVGLSALLGTVSVGAPRRQRPIHFSYDHNAIVRADTTQKALALIFTGGDYADGGWHIRGVLKKKNIKAGFFFTGDFYRQPALGPLIRQLSQDGHYLGPHSDRHLLYCAWENRDSTLITCQTFSTDLQANYRIMNEMGIQFPSSFFIPPYEWYNRQQTAWAAAMGVTLFNLTPGIGTQADYTTPDMSNYRSSHYLFQRLINYEEENPLGLRGAILLMHIGCHPARTDKFYQLLEPIVDGLQNRGYRFVRIDSLLTLP